MFYTIIFVLVLIYNFIWWMKTVEYVFEFKDDIKHPYFISLLLCSIYSFLKFLDFMEIISYDWFYLIEIISILVIRVIVINILTDSNMKKILSFVGIQYLIYKGFTPIFAFIAMLIIQNISYEYDMIAACLSIIQTPLCYYISLKVYLHIVKKHRIYVNKFLIISFISLLITFVFSNIWINIIIFIITIISFIASLYTLQIKEEEYQKSILIKKERDIMLEEYQLIDEEQLILKKQKHDFQNHLYTIRILLEKNKKKEILEYIEKYRSTNH